MLKKRSSNLFSSILLAASVTVASIAAFGSCVNPDHAAPQAKDGLLDLSHWSFSGRDAVRLDGEWEFYPDALLQPLSPAANETLFYTEIPDMGLWQNIKNKSKPLSAYGYATYRLKIALPETGVRLSIKMPEFYSSGRVFFNGNEIWQVGAIGTSAETTTADYHTGIVSVDPIGGKNEIVVQVANYSERRGGFNRSIFIGSEHSVQTLYEKSLSMDLFIFGALMSIGLYHLCLFWLRKKDHSTLWFGLFCMIISLRSLIYGERFIFSLLPTVPWAVFNKLDHLTFYAGIPIFSAYIVIVFKKEISSVAMAVYQILGAAFACFLFFPPTVYNRTVSIYEIITAGYAIYMIVVIVRALANKREGSLTTVIGLLIFLACGVNEILFNMGLVSTFNSLSIGLMLFLFTQAILLAMRSSRAFDESEHLGQTLLSMNESLRRFIPQEFFQILNRAKVDEIMLGDQVERNMTVMFCDIRSFTSIAEQLGAAKTFEFLNDYFGRIGKVIRDNGGFIDKYLGDGIIALFPGSPDEAMKAAVGIQRVVREFNESRGDSATAIAVGVGLNYGQLILGTVGETRRMDTTVIADAVNLSSRLEGLCKKYGKGIIVPVEFMENLVNLADYHWRYLGFLHVKGRKQPVELVHVFDGLADDERERLIATKDRFEAALTIFAAKDYERALAEFTALAVELPNDPAITTLIERIHRAISGHANLESGELD